MTNSRGNNAPVCPPPNNLPYHPPSRHVALSLSSLVLQLCDIGRQLCTMLPVPFACNKPSCSRLEGLSELTAVKGGRCSACKVAHYDCAACQKQHWQEHKPVCKQLQAQPGAGKACAQLA